MDVPMSSKDKSDRPDSLFNPTNLPAELQARNVRPTITKQTIDTTTLPSTPGETADSQAILLQARAGGSPNALNNPVRRAVQFVVNPAHPELVFKGTPSETPPLSGASSEGAEVSFESDLGDLGKFVDKQTEQIPTGEGSDSEFEKAILQWLRDNSGPSDDSTSGSPGDFASELKDMVSTFTDVFGDVSLGTGGFSFPSFGGWSTGSYGAMYSMPFDYYNAAYEAQALMEDEYYGF
jgi:hypothetical protein